MNADEFFQLHGGEAIRSTWGLKLFPSVLLAQAALETSFGKSLLSSRYKNYFGIKATSNWTGDVVKLTTKEVVSGKEIIISAFFRVYNTARKGFRDRNLFLIQNPRYAKNGVFDAKTPEQQAYALQKAGYATDPAYASKLISLIQKYNLKRFDNLKVVRQVASVSAIALLTIGGAYLTYKKRDKIKHLFKKR